MIFDSLHGSAVAAAGIVVIIAKLPHVVVLIVVQARVIVVLVQVFKHAGKDLGLNVRQVNAVRICLFKLATADIVKEGRAAQDFFVSREQALVTAAGYGDDGRRSFAALNGCPAKEGTR